MNGNDILMYGHEWVMMHLDGLSEDEISTPNVCGWWSIKEILMHLASFEKVTIDIFEELNGKPRGDALTMMIEVDGDEFNKVQIEARKDFSVSQVLADYQDSQARVRELYKQASPEILRQAGTIQWYGEIYDL
ncbi:MAG: maleylpyruvate isomerase N-terminal domain-containing protein [Chloroflexota bacterium]